MPIKCLGLLTWDEPLNGETVLYRINDTWHPHLVHDHISGQFRRIRSLTSLYASPKIVIRKSLSPCHASFTKEANKFLIAFLNASLVPSSHSPSNVLNRPHDFLVGMPRAWIPCSLICHNRFRGYLLSVNCGAS